MLSPEQIKQREGKLTASRVKVLMTGDAEGIMRLYQEMIGDRQPENLDHVWAVRLGEVTEHINLEWYGRKIGRDVGRRGEVVIHQRYPWAACTLDGWDDDLKCPVECKHSSGRIPLEVFIDNTQPQLQWQMFVTFAQQCALSVIFGANEPVVEYIERDNGYIDEMFNRAKRFMICVHARLPPVTLAAVPPPVPMDKMREADMSGNEIWCKNADIWKQSYLAAKSAKDAEQVLKNFVEADVRKAWGNGVRITRDKANRLSLREDK